MKHTFEMSLDDAISIAACLMEEYPRRLDPVSYGPPEDPVLGVRDAMAYQLIGRTDPVVRIHLTGDAKSGVLREMLQETETEFVEYTEPEWWPSNS